MEKLINGWDYMNANKTVSIIVPVYNAESALNNCVDSILRQSYNNIEVILINDGSTDNSGMICNDYAISDRRIKVMHQLNAGPSRARNAGIKAAVGDYIQFVDADDFLERNMTRTLVESIEEGLQLVICGYQSIDREQNQMKKYIPPNKGIYQNNDFMQYFGQLYKSIILPSLWNKLYRTTMINEFNIHFIENLSLGEDLLFNLDYLTVCNKINVIPSQLYNYVVDNDQSLSKAFKKDLIDNQQMLHKKVVQFLINKNCYTKENKYLLQLIYTNSIVNVLSNIFHKNSILTTKQQKAQIKDIISNTYVRQNIGYFKDSIQARLIGSMIKSNSINGIYGLFKAKGILQSKLNPLYNLLNKINSKYDL